MPLAAWCSTAVADSFGRAHAWRNPFPTARTLLVVARACTLPALCCAPCALLCALPALSHAVAVKRRSAPRGPARLQRTPFDLELFVADSPLGPWQPHPLSPVQRQGRAAGARMAGRLALHNGRLHRFGQDCGQTYGHRVG